MKYTYDKEANAVYIYLNEKPYSFGRRLDNERSIDYADDGTPIGVEMLYVNSGVNITGFPEPDEISLVLGEIGIPVYNLEGTNENQYFNSTSSVNVCYFVANDPSPLRYDEPQCTFVHTRQIPKSIKIPEPELEEVTA